MTTRMTLKTFEIRIVGPNETYSDQLYANGNQQLAVSITVLKQVSENNGPWKKASLSATEKTHLSIRKYSSNTNEPLPAGWHDDVTPNEFTSPGGAPRAPAGSAKADLNAVPDIFTRYLRAETTTAGAPQQFMARIQLDDGKVYTTYFDDNNNVFNGAVSKVTVAPRRPDIIQAKELVLNFEQPYRVEYKKNNYVDVDVYYWTLPRSLHIVQEKFSGQEVSQSAKLEYAYARNDNPLQIGAAIKTETESLTLGDIGNVPSGVSGETNISLIKNNNRTQMRALRYSCNDMSAPAAYDHLLYWTIVDNLGCVSQFVLKSQADDAGKLGDQLELVQAG